MAEVVVVVVVLVTVTLQAPMLINYVTRNNQVPQVYMEAVSSSACLFYNAKYNNKPPKINYLTSQATDLNKTILCFLACLKISKWSQIFISKVVLNVIPYPCMEEPWSVVL
ncbi:hypothetical protein NQ315_013102 [Exocentrus adspersus]|uniref:Uncharacterized protein n=1 Tax=Exocentrus adspersus TaxID=1586481 RepID=A0AAV8VX09_9CUCU|nr:hypothetical protein NQ315_013102 [Exocentrus adspersus]